MKAITYTFHFENGLEARIPLTFSPKMVVEERLGEEWATLEHHRCEHCPLPATGSCPFAAALAPFVHAFDDYFSYEPVTVEVETPQRTVKAQRPLQHGLASLIGLVGATSGCPHLTFLRPMARFHLPFSSEEETLFRVFSIHMLGRYIRGGHGSAVKIDLDALNSSYQAAALVNRGMADRVRNAFAKDAVVNALAILDTFAQAIPYVIEERLEELQYIFAE